MSTKVPPEFKSPQSRRSREQIAILNKKFAELKEMLEEIEYVLNGNGHGHKTRLTVVEGRVDVLIKWMDEQKKEFTPREFHDMKARLKLVEDRINNIGGAWALGSLIIQAGGIAAIIGFLKYFLDGLK